MKIKDLRARKGFIFTEILTGLILQAGLILSMMFCARYLILFYVKMSRILLARERAQNVILYLEPRIKNAGLGLWKCQTDANTFHNVFTDTQMGLKALEEFKYPLNVTNNFYSGEPPKDLNGIITGKCLSVLYSPPHEGLNVVLESSKSEILQVSPDHRAKNYLIRGNYDKDTFDSRVYHYSATSHRDIRSWIVIPSAGIPFFAWRNGSYLEIKMSSRTNLKAELPAVTDFLLMRAERFYTYTIEDSKTGQKSYELRADELITTKWNVSSLEKGIIKMHLELHKKSNTLDLYLLSEGGEYVSLSGGENSKPKAWPDNADWDDEFLKHELHVQKASFKIENVNFY